MHDNRMVGKLTGKSGGLTPPFHQNLSQKLKPIIQKWATMKHLIHEHRDATVLIRVKGTIRSLNSFQSKISSEFNWHTEHTHTHLQLQSRTH